MKMQKGLLNEPIDQHREGVHDVRIPMRCIKKGSLYISQMHMRGRVASLNAYTAAQGILTNAADTPLLFNLLSLNTLVLKI
jgi:hypothetical protein